MNKIRIGFHNNAVAGLEAPGPISSFHIERDTMGNIISISVEWQDRPVLKTGCGCDCDCGTVGSFEGDMGTITSLQEEAIAKLAELFNKLPLSEENDEESVARGIGYIGFPRVGNLWTPSDIKFKKE